MVISNDFLCSTAPLSLLWKEKEISVPVNSPDLSKLITMDSYINRKAVIVVISSLTYKQGKRFNSALC